MSDDGAHFKRSPFCLLHWEGPNLFARNCNRPRLFRISARYLPVLHYLSDWTTIEELAPLVSLEAGRLRRVVDRLVDMGLALQLPGAEDGKDAEWDHTSWDLIDLAFQRKTSRGGYDGQPRLDPPPPAFKAPPDGPAIKLDEVGLDKEYRLQAALDDRRSIRTYAPDPLQLADLGRFLYTVARVKRVRHDPAMGTVSARPSPSAGGRNPLELYPLCNEVAGLEPGAYYYHPRHHALYLVKARDEQQREITRLARTSTGDVCNRDPAVVMAVTAVFERTMWKYDNIALSLILKDVGALYQTMYLAATALGLAPCALGGWMEEENARWLGLDPLVESQVGAFLLGYPGSPGPVR